MKHIADRTMRAQMRGKCVVLAVLGHDSKWLTQLQALHTQSGCLVFAYVSEERLKSFEEEGRSNAAGLFIKAIDFAKTSLDSEYEQLLRLVAPVTQTLVLFDGTMTDATALKVRPRLELIGVSRRFHLPCEPTSSTLNTIWSCGLFEGKGVSTSRVSPTRGPLSPSLCRAVRSVSASCCMVLSRS
jgi:hypothetical protein